MKSPTVALPELKEALASYLTGRLMKDVLVTEEVRKGGATTH